MITGATGLLGQDLVRVFGAGHEVVGVSRRHPQAAQRLDVSSEEDTRRLISGIRPDWVLHAAAQRSPDYCARHPEECFRINVLGSRNIAWACRETGAKLLYISTDYVFDGLSSKPYIEPDLPSPVNEYGISKLAGEVYTQYLVEASVVARVSTLYGEGGESFVSKTLEAAQQGRTTMAAEDIVSSPSWTMDIAEGLLTLVERVDKAEAPKAAWAGLYHLASPGEVSRYDLARKALELAGLDPERVKRSSMKELSLPAVRAGYTALASSRFEAGFIPRLRPWEEALGAFIRSRRETLLR